MCFKDDMALTNVDVIISSGVLKIGNYCLFVCVKPAIQHSTFVFVYVEDISASQIDDQIDTTLMSQKKNSNISEATNESSSTRGIKHDSISSITEQLGSLFL